MPVINFTDIETTGGNDPEHRIIEVCCKRVDFDTRACLSLNTWRINPERKIDRGAQNAHGITLAELANEPTWGVIAPSIMTVLTAADLGVAHNGDEFDWPFIAREFRRIGINVNLPRTFDTMAQARWATPTGKIPRLGELAHALDVEYDPSKAHAADYDVSVMEQCFFNGVDLGFFQPFA